MSQPERRSSTQRGHVTRLAPTEDAASRIEPNGRASKARERSQRRREDSAYPKVDWTWAVMGAAIVGILCLVSLVISTALQGNQQPTATLAVVNGTPAPTPTTDFKITAWDGQKRYTILIMGLDKRPGEEGTGFRTDSMILVSINPATKQVGMLSIPRDIFVPIPGDPEMQQINRVYVLGELDRPGGGPRKLMDTLQYNLGMKIDSYVAVTFESVIKAVDAVGGVEIDVPVTIDDPEYPDMNFGYQPLHIEAGRQHMNGELALKYARTRHQSSDFDRTQRQQQVILAIRQQAVKPEVLARLATNAPSLWNDLSQGLLTDLSFDQILSMGWYLKDLPSDNFKRGGLIDKYIQATTIDGNSVLVINRSNTIELLTNVFGADYNK
ncbi:MAG: LCP family protein [Anaerolineae bacterium]|nr:LCP family protein [Anaerolineae bacterium]